VEFQDQPIDQLPSQQRPQRLANGANDYVLYMLTPEGVINSWNSNAQQFKDYVSSEIVGQHFSCFYTPEDIAADKPAKALQIALTEGKFEDEGWRIHRNGDRFWASFVIDPIRDSAGQLVGFVKVMRDITKRGARQEALHQSEEHFRLLVQSVTDYAIYMLSPTGVVTNWNIGAERIKGYTEAEAVGIHFSRFYTEEDRNNGEPARALAVAAKEGRFEKEGWRLRKDGTRFMANIIIDAIYGNNGKLLGFAKITRDITERQQAAQALEQARATLFQSQKMEAVGQLTGGIAHDFNNLLTVIVNSLDLLSRKLYEPSDIRLLENAQRSAERGTKLTQQLLAFARRQPLRPDKYNLNTLISGFEAILRRACHELIAVDVTLASRLKTVLLDAQQFEAALLNLIVNARDAMPNGGEIHLLTENVELGERDRIGSLAPGAYVKVTVRDTGFGMPAEVVLRAFEPFFTTKEIGKGTGLGLSQVYGFVTQSGGEVIIESEVRKGTSVMLYLPVIGDAAHDADSAVGMPGQPAHMGKVLIVEDEPDVLDVSVEIFRSIGYEVMTAGNGLEAIDVLKRTRDIDVLFTDVVMPKGMSGIDLARFTRKLCPDIKVILASGYPLRAIAEDHGQLDEFSFISKPYRWSELVEKLRIVRESVA
jgi:PAS domain S-box-containing protein